jgi:hypothetical protein
MKSLAIIDSLTLTYKNQIFGHYASTAKQLYSILCNDFAVKVVGGITYANYFQKEQLDILPYRTYYEEFHIGNTFRKLRSKIKSIINLIVALRKNYDYLIFQWCSQNFLYLTLLLFKKKRSKVFLIKYNAETRLTHKLLFRLIKNKVSCIFTSMPKTGESYGIPYLLIPDYFPVEEDLNSVSQPVVYDFVIVGTTDNDKNIEDVISGIEKTNFTIKIAGNFKDKAYLEKIQKLTTSKNILIQDKYLTDTEYKNTILQSKYVILPYLKSAYTDKSSGVVLDAVYRGKPVIAPDLSGFQPVKDFGMGYLYNESISEILPKINDENYHTLVQNAIVFRNAMESKKQELIQTILKA